MVGRISLSAQPRTILGRKVKTLRSRGGIPANIYGRGLKSAAVVVDVRAFHETFEKAGETSVVNLAVDKEEPRPVLIHHVQTHPVTGAPLHVDFYQVDLKKTVRVNVPIEIVGESPAVLAKEGLLEQPVTALEIEALPTDLPESIHVDISGLVVVDDTLHVKDLSIPNNITVLSDMEEVVIKIGPLVTAEMQKAIEVEEAATAAAAATTATAESEEGAPPGEGEVVSQQGETSTTPNEEQAPGAESKAEKS